MKWATLALIHFDRVASAWLILRFVDKEAEFIFLEKGASANADVTLFGMPGARLGSHDAGVTAFQRILRAYEIADPALEELGRIGADAVAHVMQDGERRSASRRNALASGLLAVAEGMMLLSASDAECLNQSIPVYDAFYARLQAQQEIDRRAPSPPATVLEQTLLFSRGARDLRAAGTRYNPAAFAKVLEVERGQ